MTRGIGGSTPTQELEKLTNMAADIEAIRPEEYQRRLAKARSLMKEQGIRALYLNAGTNLQYFTGTQWYASERLVGAILPADGELFYLAPAFEQSTLERFMVIEADVATWHEHEDPYRLAIDCLAARGISNGRLAIDESTAFFMVDGLRRHGTDFQLVNGNSVTARCRQQKSPAEIALLQRAKEMTLAVQRSAARILHPGITTGEVSEFIHRAHIAVGAPAGSYFCIVLFGEDTAYPHGVKHPKSLETNDMVLIDTGCELEGYHSDITRSYVFGEATARQRQVWEDEKAAQAAAFEAAQLGQPCEAVDKAARSLLESRGYGPDYALPGLPHRTGHGIGLDIHEWPYLVRNDRTALAEGMCFSNEPMLCIPGEFGVRLEDHFYMTAEGPRWFTLPSRSIDDPFGEQE